MDPELKRALADARAVRFLCSGNVVRSAFAELWLRHRLQSRDRDLSVDSAATTYYADSLHPETRQALFERGVDEAQLAAFEPRHMSTLGVPPDSLVVFGMTWEHLLAWRARWPNAEHLYLLTACEAPRRRIQREIQDPVMDGVPFKSAFERVEACVEGLMSELEDLR